MHVKMLMRISTFRLLRDSSEDLETEKGSQGEGVVLKERTKVGRVERRESRVGKIVIRHEAEENSAEEKGDRNTHEGIKRTMSQDKVLRL